MRTIGILTPKLLCTSGYQHINIMYVHRRTRNIILPCLYLSFCTFTLSAPTKISIALIILLLLESSLHLKQTQPMGLPLLYLQWLFYILIIKTFIIVFINKKHLNLNFCTFFPASYSVSLYGLVFNTVNFSKPKV